MLIKLQSNSYPKKPIYKSKNLFLEFLFFILFKKKFIFFLLKTIFSEKSVYKS